VHAAAVRRVAAVQRPGGDRGAPRPTHATSAAVRRTAVNRVAARRAAAAAPWSGPSRTTSPAAAPVTRTKQTSNRRRPGDPRRPPTAGRTHRARRRHRPAQGGTPAHTKRPSPRRGFSTTTKKKDTTVVDPTTHPPAGRHRRVRRPRGRAQSAKPHATAVHGVVPGCHCRAATHADVRVAGASSRPRPVRRAHAAKGAPPTRARHATGGSDAAGGTCGQQAVWTGGERRAVDGGKERTAVDGGNGPRWAGGKDRGGLGERTAANGGKGAHGRGGTAHSGASRAGAAAGEDAAVTGGEAGAPGCASRPPPTHARVHVGGWAARAVRCGGARGRASLGICAVQGGGGGQGAPRSGRTPPLRGGRTGASVALERCPRRSPPLPLVL